MTSFKETLPVEMQKLDLSGTKTGLVMVDIVNGFATLGAGALAPQQPNAQIDHMIEQADMLAKKFCKRDWPVLAFRDSHAKGKPEPPYPPHCEKGTGEDELVDELKWLEKEDAAFIMRKDCINGYIGAINPSTGANNVNMWIRNHGLDTVLVCGICTDICVMDFVLTLLSARNHNLCPPLQTVAVYAPACATYDLPRDIAKKLGLPATATHPQQQCHHTGLYMMASRGAVICDKIKFK